MPNPYRHDLRESRGEDSMWFVTKALRNVVAVECLNFSLIGKAHGREFAR